MITREQVSIIGKVYNGLLASECSGWDDMDNNLEYLGYLSDDQLQKEAEVISIAHAVAGKICCPDGAHPIGACLSQDIVKAAITILQIYRDIGQLTRENRYVLEHYLAMHQAGYIVPDKH